MARFGGGNGTDSLEEYNLEDYGALLVGISQELHQRDVETLCARYLLSSAKTAEIQGIAIRLFQELERQNLLSPSNVTTLKDGLRQLDLKKAVRLIDEFLDHSVHLSDADHEDIRKMYCMALSHSHPLEYELKNLPNYKLNVVLVGKTGNGKSATGNTLLGCKQFKEGDEWDSCTETTEIAHFNEKPLLMDVIDTPGLFDTSKGGVKNEVILTEIAKTAMQVSEGVHVFLLVCRTDARFTKEEIDAVKEIESKFGQDVYDFTILAFTRGKHLRKGGKSLEHRLTSCKTQEDFMQQLKMKVCNRALAVENSDCSEKFLRFQQVRLYSAICELVTQNGMRTYTNDILARVEELRQQEIKKRKREQLITKKVPSFVTKRIMQSSEEELVFIKENFNINETQMEDLICELNSHGQCTFQKTDVEFQVEKEIKQQVVMIDECLNFYATQRKVAEEYQKKKERLEAEIEVNNLIRNVLFLNIDTFTEETLECLINDPGENANEVLNLEGIQSQLQQYDEILDIQTVATNVISEQQSLFQKEIGNRIKERDQREKEMFQAKEKACRLSIISRLHTLAISKLDKVKRNLETIDIESFLNENDPQESSNEYRTMMQRIFDEVIKTEIDSILIKKGEERRKIAGEMFLTDLPKVLKEKLKEASIEELENITKGIIPKARYFNIDFDPEVIDEKEIDSYILHYFKNKCEISGTLFAIRKQAKRQEQKENFKDKIAKILDDKIESFCLNLPKKKLKSLRKKVGKNKKDNDLFHILKTTANDHMQKDLPDNKLSDNEMDDIIESSINRYISLFDAVKEECKKKCFPGSAMVVEKSTGLKLISKVQIGDQILTVTSEGRIVFEDVYLIAHAYPNDLVPYISITTDSNVTINLTVDHCLFVGSTKHYKRASEVKTGNLIFIIKDGACVPDRVASINQTYLTGAYCPYTNNGNVIVDFVAASCFTTTFSPIVSQRLLTPVRLLYSMLPLPVYQTIFGRSNVKYVLGLSRRAKLFILRPFKMCTKLLQF